MLTWNKLKEILHNKNQGVDYSVVKSLLRNKVLYLAGLINVNLRNNEEWKELSRRRKLQLEALAEFSDVAERLGVRYVIVKTFKLFPYVPDDIDILILDSDMIDDIVSELIKKGFKVRSKGTPEITLTKVASKTFADLDMHSKMAAGEYVYYPSEILWQNARKAVINHARLNVASWDDECTITIAHAIMKEFEVPASDILQFMLCKKKGYIKFEHLKKTGHAKTYEVFLKIYKIVIQGNKVLPYRVPLIGVALAYIYNVSHRVHTEKLKPIYELISFPKAKGMKKLIYGMI
jgi:hypothetical protein